MASDDGATLKVTELFSMAHSTANVCVWRLHGCVLDFIHLLAMGMDELAESTNLKSCPHAFSHVVYVTYNKSRLCISVCVLPFSSDGKTDFP